MSKGGHIRGDKSMGLVHAISTLKSLHGGTGCVHTRELKESSKKTRKIKGSILPLYGFPTVKTKSVLHYKLKLSIKY